MVHIEAVLVAVLGQAVAVLAAVIHLSIKAGRVLQMLEDHEQRIDKLESLRT